MNRKCIFERVIGAVNIFDGLELSINRDSN